MWRTKNDECSKQLVVMLEQKLWRQSGSILLCSLTITWKTISGFDSDAFNQSKIYCSFNE